VLDQLPGLLSGRRVVERLEEHVLVDDVSGTLFPGIEQYDRPRFHFEHGQTF
jgi:hypothetical protein